MELLDIHTHHTPAKPGTAIENCFPKDFSPQSGHYYSVGFHPWYISSDDEQEDWNAFCEIVKHPQVLAVGECGLDKITQVDRKVQEEVFIKQLQIAEVINKPVIIHAVRTHNEIIRLKKELKPVAPWIIHGFRGKKEQALQLTDHGIYLSFGEKYNEEALPFVPHDKIFIETDESTIDINDLYRHAASVRSVAVNEFATQIGQNIKKVFFNR